MYSRVFAAIPMLWLLDSRGCLVLRSKTFVPLSVSFHAFLFTLVSGQLLQLGLMTPPPLSLRWERNAPMEMQ